MHSLLRHPLQSETKTEPDLRLPRCMFLRVVGNCCVRFETQKLTISNSNSIWNARTRLNEFIRTPMFFVGKQAIYNLQFFFPVKRLSQQLPRFLLFSDHRSVAQQCWIRLHSSSNNAHHTRFKKSCRLYTSHDALQVPTLLGSCCIRLDTTAYTRTQQLPTFLGQQCWELLRPFACSLKALSVHRLILQFCNTGINSQTFCIL